MTRSDPIVHASPDEVTGAVAATRRMWAALGGEADAIARLSFHANGALPSRFKVTDFASGAWAAACLSVAELAGASHAPLSLSIDRRLASMWCKWSLRPVGWNLPSATEPVSGDYAAADGWIRLHAAGVTHRAAALRVLDLPPDKERLAAKIVTLSALELEFAVVEQGGCAAQMRSIDAWASHEQGAAVAREPLVHFRATDPSFRHDWTPVASRPLAGLKVLDLTRILAGPIATRFLAGYGADVLRIDPVEWDEGLVIPEVTLGKRCARLDLKTEEGREAVLGLLKDADILVHGYRADALERLGLGEAVRRETAPGLVDVSLNAYGWTGPWKDRRGFDSLVQMSSGIAHAGMAWRNAAKPVPLPVQALDHVTGYLMAAAAVRGIALRQRDGCGSAWRLSLARTGLELVSLGENRSDIPLALETDADVQSIVERTPWGDAHRLNVPGRIEGAPLYWDSGARALGSDISRWL